MLLFSVINAQYFLLGRNDAGGTVNKSRPADNVNMDLEMKFFVILSFICNFSKLIFMILVRSKNGAAGWSSENQAL